MILFFSMIRRPLRCTLFPYTTLFRSVLVELGGRLRVPSRAAGRRMGGPGAGAGLGSGRSEEHTSGLQSRGQLVCRLLLEKKKRELHHFSYQMEVLLFTSK